MNRIPDKQTDMKMSLTAIRRRKTIVSMSVQRAPFMTRQYSFPQVDFVYSSLRDRSTLEERQRLWYLLAQLHPDSAALSAELLGFDADRLMQELQVRACISSAVY